MNMSASPSEVPSNKALAIEALLVAADSPVPIEAIKAHCPGVDVIAELRRLGSFWHQRGVVVEFDQMTARMRVPDAVASRLDNEGSAKRRLTQAGMETLAVIAMHQPVTLQDIEKLRGVSLSRAIMDTLVGADLVRVALRKTDSGRAAVYMITDLFLEEFGLGSLADLPRPEEVGDLINPPREESYAE